MSDKKVQPALVQTMLASLTFEFARIGDSTTTVCEAFLPNGFSVGSGKSACVDPASFDYGDGCKYAKENAEADAKNTIWQLEGYLLKVAGKTSDSFEAETPLGRLLTEKAELKDRLNKLVIFLSDDRPKFISVDDWDLLDDQRLVMHKYLDILNARIKSFKE